MHRSVPGSGALGHNRTPRISWYTFALELLRVVASELLRAVYQPDSNDGSVLSKPLLTSPRFQDHVVGLHSKNGFGLHFSRILPRL